MPIDVTQAIRFLRRTPLLALGAILSLAVGVALVTTGFAVIRGMLFSTLPVPGGDRIVLLRDYNRSGGWELYLNGAEFTRRRSSLTSFDGVEAFYTRNVALDDSSQTRVISAAYVTGGALPLVGAAAERGRIFAAAEGSQAPAVIVGSELSAAMFGGASPLGSMVRVDGVAHEVVGVLPAGFRFPFNQQLWLPIRADASGNPSTAEPLRVFARLAPGADRRRAEAEVVAVAAADPTRLAADGDVVQIVSPFTRTTQSLEQEMVLWAVMVALLLLLTVSAASVGNLLLARHSGRTREIAIRRALGASRARVMSEMLIEALVLGTVAATLGLTAAGAGLEWLSRSVSDLPFWLRFEIDRWAVVFALATAGLIAAAAGLGPAFKTTTLPVQDVLRRSAPRLRFGSLSTAMVVVEVATAIGCLSGAAALGRGLLGFGYQEYGLPEDRMLVAQLYFGQPPGLERVDAPDDRTARRAIADEFYRVVDAEQLTLGESLLRVAGVRAVARASHFPGNELSDSIIEIESADRQVTSARTRVVEVDDAFFTVLNARTVAGRLLAPADIKGPSSVVIVNEPFAQKHFRGSNPIGHVLYVRNRAEAGRPHEIVGVVRDLGLNPGDPTRRDGVYVPMRPTNVLRFAILTDADPATLTQRLHTATQALAHRPQIQWTKTLRQQLAEPVAILRGFGAALSAIGAVALLLACQGVYALLSFSLAQRRREIAIRAALGASRGELVRAVAGSSARQLLAGAIAGVLLGGLVMQIIALVPFDIARGGGLFLTGSALLLVSAAAAACINPIRRAVRFSVMDGLRES